MIFKLSMSEIKRIKTQDTERGITSKIILRLI